MYAFTYHRPDSVAAAAALADGRRQAARRRPDAAADDEAAARLARPRSSISARSPNSPASLAKATPSSIGAMTRHADVAASARRRSGDSGARRARRHDRRSGGAHIAARSAARSPTTIRPPTIRRPRWRSARRSSPTSARSPPTISSRACSRRRSSDGEIITKVRFPIPQKAGLREVPQSRLALRAGRRVRRQDGGRRARRGDGRGLERRVPRRRVRSGARPAISPPPRLTASPFRRRGLNTDLHADAAYRAHLIVVLAKRAVAAAG